MTWLVTFVRKKCFPLTHNNIEFDEKPQHKPISYFVSTKLPGAARQSEGN